MSSLLVQGTAKLILRSRNQPSSSRGSAIALDQRKLHSEPHLVFFLDRIFELARELEKHRQGFDRNAYIRKMLRAHQLFDLSLLPRAKILELISLGIYDEKINFQLMHNHILRK
jgi:hypothetical protein